MDHSTLKKEQLIEIYVPSLQQYYKVKVTQIEDNSIIIEEVNHEDYQSDPDKLPLDLGKLYLIYIGMDQNVYCGKTKLLDTEKTEDGRFVYVLEKPEQLTPQERRRSSRVPYNENVYYRLENSPDKEFTKSAQAVDLSKGGMSLIVEEYCKPQSIILVKFYIEEIELFVRAKVKWIKKDQSKNRYTIGINFLELSPQMQ